MLRNTALVGLLMVPGAFLILGLACLHPRLRKEIVRLGGLSSPLAKAGRAYTGIRARLLLHPGHPRGRRAKPTKLDRHT
jgi:hypothetical protein